MEKNKKISKKMSEGTEHRKYKVIYQVAEDTPIQERERRARRAFDLIFRIMEEKLNNQHNRSKTIPCSKEKSYKKSCSPTNSLSNKFALANIATGRLGSITQKSLHEQKWGNSAS
ncbi:MAG: hypothetical protein WBD99_02620 [Thermodesulfobacteriota bacterium]